MKRITEIEKRVKRGGLIFEINKYVYNFLQFEIIGSFVKTILNGEITLNNAD